MLYYLLIIGCQMNRSDAERLGTLLQSHGAIQTHSSDAADVLIVVSCSVRQKAMDRIYGMVPQWNKRRCQRKLQTVLTGCVLPYDRKRLREAFDHFIEIKDIERLPRLLGLAKKKDTPTVEITNADYLALPTLHSSPFQAYVPIMTGCNNYCTYCAVPHTRGQEASRPASAILREVTSLINHGYKEITLLGQNVNAYIDPEQYHDEETIETRSREFWRFRPDQPIQWRSATTRVPKDFAELLKTINAIPGDFWLRFITSNPQDVSDELINTLPQCEKLTPYFHLPIQSGDDEILQKMNRRHNRDYYLTLIDKIRTAWPGVAITTDIIVGFPGETAKQFQHTADLMRQVQYDMAYIAEYSPRPGTAAARFFEDDIPSGEKSRRKKELNAILEKTALQQNNKLIDQDARVLVERYDPDKKINTAKTAGFKNIRFTGPDYKGSFVTLRVDTADTWGLSGTIKKLRPI